MSKSEPIAEVLRELKVLISFVLLFKVDLKLLIKGCVLKVGYSLSKAASRKALVDTRRVEPGEVDIVLEASRNLVKGIV